MGLRNLQGPQPTTDKLLTILHIMHVQYTWCNSDFGELAMDLGPTKNDKG